MRRVRQLLKKDAALAHSLRQALTSGATEKSDQSQRTTRRVTPTFTDAPATLDGELNFLRVENQSALPFEPVYSGSVRASLAAIVREHTNPASLQKAGLYPIRTALLSGPPGVGKTLAARWIAHELNRPLLILDLGTVMSRFLGATGANLKRAIAYASDSRGILFLDELDAVAKRRDDSADIGELKRLVTVLLQELDEWPAGRLLLAATNHPQLLDDAVWRRFEARIEVPRPTEEDLRALLNELTREAKLPSTWAAILPPLFAGSSHSDFTRALVQLRKTLLLEPDLSTAETFRRFASDRLASLSGSEARSVAVALANAGGVSQRQISELLHVSRDTLRRSTTKGGKRRG